MESRLGADFSDVRIHDDRAARASAAQVGARAYTCGSHVVIGDGGEDKQALVHELTHVIQQRQGPVAGSDLGGGLKISDPSDRHERAAEATAARVMCALLSEHPLAAGSPAQPGRVVQRTIDVAVRYSTPSSSSKAMAKIFRDNHVPADFTEQKAIGIHQNRGYPISTIIRITGADISHEIYEYLFGLDQNATANLGNNIRFTTEDEYEIIEVEESANQIMSTSSFKTKIILEAGWTGEYYQVYHYVGTST
jgi:hypothetical protein